MSTNLDTRLVHSGHMRDGHHGASSVPIYQVSTYHQEDPEHLSRYDYARSDNPTREALETAICELEGGTRGFAFASGMAAISSVLAIFHSGAHIVVSTDIYGGTFRVLNTVFKRWGLDCSFVDMTDLDELASATRDNTVAILAETPSNPTLKISDLAAIAKFARERSLVSICDNTFMTPLLQRPIENGFDISLHSATKFIGGHSDLVAGLAVASGSDLAHRVRQVQNSFGAILGPQDSWLTLRGLRTLGARLRAQQESAAKVADFLSSRKDVRRVCYPSLKGHPGREIHLRQSSGGGAVVSFDLSSREHAVSTMRRVKLPLVAVSLGGVESILSYPTTMSHAAMPSSERQARGISDSLLRLSLGLENVEDIIADLEQAMSLG